MTMARIMQQSSLDIIALPQAVDSFISFWQVWGQLNETFVSMSTNSQIVDTLQYLFFLFITITQDVNNEHLLKKENLSVFSST